MNGNTGNTPLHNAVQFEQVEIVELLVHNENCNPNIANKIQKYPKDIAKEKENHNMIRLLYYAQDNRLGSNRAVTNMIDEQFSSMTAMSHGGSSRSNRSSRGNHSAGDDDDGIVSDDNYDTDGAGRGSLFSAARGSAGGGGGNLSPNLAAMTHTPTLSAAAALILSDDDSNTSNIQNKERASSKENLLFVRQKTNELKKRSTYLRLDTFQLAKDALPTLRGFLEKKRPQPPYVFQKRWVIVEQPYILWNDEKQFIKELSGQVIVCNFSGNWS